MSIVLQRYSILETGDFEIRQQGKLAISANQARHLVNRFLLMDMSTMLAVETPDLVIDERTVWPCAGVNRLLAPGGQCSRCVATPSRRRR